MTSAARLRIAVAAVAALGPTRLAGEAAPPCALETLPAAHAACLGLAADRLLVEMELRLAGFTAEALGVPAERAAEIGPALAGAQAAWRREMEAGCAAQPLPQDCRLAAAQARASRLAALITEARARHGLPAARAAPGCAVLLDQLSGSPPDIQAGQLRIECDLTPFAEPGAPLPPGTR